MLYSPSLCWSFSGLIWKMKYVSICVRNWVLKPIFISVLIMYYSCLHLVLDNIQLSLWNMFMLIKNFLEQPTLGRQIDEYTRLFGTKETWRMKQTQRQTRVFNENPPYSFIWPYSFNWHLRVGQVDTYFTK